MNIIIPLLLLSTLIMSSCSDMYAQLTYDFNQLENNTNIHYEDGAKEIAEQVSHLLSQSLNQVVSEEYIEFKDPDDINVYVFDSEERYATYSNSSIEIRGSSATNDIYLSPKIEDEYTLQSILVHELSLIHMRQHVRTWGAITNIPTWFNKGLAVTTSKGGGAENISEEEAIKSISNGKHFLPVVDTGFFSRKYAHDYGLTPHMFYRQSSLFINYLIKENPKAFREIYISLSNGENFAGIWKKHYGKTMSHLWVEFLLTTAC